MLKMTLHFHSNLLSRLILARDISYRKMNARDIAKRLEISPLMTMLKKSSIFWWNTSKNALICITKTKMTPSTAPPLTIFKSIT